MWIHATAIRIDFLTTSFLLSSLIPQSHPQLQFQMYLLDYYGTAAWSNYRLLPLLYNCTHAPWHHRFEIGGLPLFHLSPSKAATLQRHVLWLEVHSAVVGKGRVFFVRACEEEKFLEGARGEDRPSHVVKKRKGRRQRSAVGVPQKRSFLLPPIFGCCGKSWISSSSSSSSRI